MCNTYKICEEYANIVRKEYDELKVKRRDLFEGTDYLKKYNISIEANNSIET